MALKQETKQAIGDALAEAIHRAAQVIDRDYRTLQHTHYRVSIDAKGMVAFEFAEDFDYEPDAGWIPLDEATK